MFWINRRILASIWKRCLLLHMKDYADLFSWNSTVFSVFCPFHFAVTPHNYHPPGFKEGVNSHFLLFEGNPVNLQAGLVSTGFHSMKLKVTTEATRVSDLEDRVFQESSTTEIAHQGLDCDEEEEEEECNNHVRQSCSDPPLLQLNPVDIFQFIHRSYHSNRIQWSVPGVKTETKLAPNLESLF